MHASSDPALIRFEEMSDYYGANLTPDAFQSMDVEPVENIIMGDWAYSMGNFTAQSGTANIDGKYSALLRRQEDIVSTFNLWENDHDQLIGRFIMLARTVSVISVLALSGCASFATDAESSKQEMIASIVQLYKLESTCGASGQELIDASDATSFGVNAAKIVNKSDRNADAREDALCADGGSVEFQPDIAGVRFLTSDVALLHGISSYREIAGDGSVLLDGAFNFTHVFQLIDGDWKIQHTHVAPLFPEE